MKLRALVVALVVAALGVSAATVVQAPARAALSTPSATAAVPASSLDCVGNDVVLVGARGIGEAPQSVGWDSSDAHSNLGPTLWSLFGVLQQKFPAVRFGSEGVNYRPVPASTWWSPPSVSALVASASSGAQSFVGLIHATIAACPNVHLIVAGYSEGAWVLHQALNTLTPADLGHIAAVVAYGDPGYDPAVGYGYGPSTLPSWPGVGTVLDHAHSGLPASLLPVTADVCRAGDPICHTSLNNHSWLQAVAACATAVKTSRPQLCPDLDYDATTATNNTAAATFIGKHLPPSSPQITTTALDDGFAGLAYLQQVTASGGLSPYTFTATGLPNGLTISSDGVVSGTPTATGTAQVTLTVTDANSITGAATLPLVVTQSLPTDCISQACALLTPDGQTTQITAAQIGGVTRDPTTGAITQAILIGVTPAADQVLVFAANDAIPSGLIAVADTVTPNADGTTTVTLTPAGPADAYADGTVKTVAAPITAVTTASPALSPELAPAAAVSPLSCTGGVTAQLHGLGVTPSLTPTVAAIWAHPFFGGGGIYIGTGGLSLFQFDLDGNITVNLGVTVSGASTCTLTLPAIKATVPAGELGAVLLSLTPKLTLNVTGKVDLRTSVALTCGTEYRWFRGAESRNSYCEPKFSPLALSADSGVDATLTAALDASVTLDDIVGITGTLSAALHAGYHPAARPVVEVDTTVDYELGGCFACFWDGTPAKVTLASGILFHAVLYSSETPPPPPTTGGGTSTLTDVVNVDTWGDGTRCAVLSSGGVDCWGGNGTQGDLGAGPNAAPAGYSDVPVAVIGITNATSVSSDRLGSCAVLASGGVDCWGENTYGELGAGLNPGTNSNVPLPAVGITNATSLSVGGFASYCAVLTSGRVDCWGDNGAGELGAGLNPNSTGNSNVPVAVAGITHATRVSTAGAGTFCALLTSGGVDCWGRNGAGELGAGLDPNSIGYSDVPVPVGVSHATSVSAGGDAFCAVLTNGGVDCWGDNGFGELGAGLNPNSIGYTDVPVSVGITNAISIGASGDNTFCAVLTSGGVDCWGENGNGELGAGLSPASSGYSDVPVAAVGVTRAIAVSGDGNNGFCALLTTGGVDCWGDNTDGELGAGLSPATAQYSDVPVAAAITNVRSVSAGGFEAFCAVLTSSGVDCWGGNILGDLGAGLDPNTTTYSDIPLAVVPPT